MRELRVNTFDATHLTCDDPESGDTFQIPIEDVRAALDLLSPEAESESATEDAGTGSPSTRAAADSADERPTLVRLRPREIQSKVRAGATVAELAELSGVAADKIERFAHPVLLERSRAAELARASHPLVAGGPSVSTLGELVAECLVLRGSGLAESSWDAWKAEEGQWVVQLSWRTGSSDFYAHWRFYPGAHGGTTDPIDEFAVELTDPERARAARRVTPTVVRNEPAAFEPAGSESARFGSARFESAPVTPTPIAAAREARAIRERSADGHEQVTVEADSITDAQSRRRQTDSAPTPNATPAHTASPDVAAPTAPAEPADGPTSAEPEPDTLPFAEPLTGETERRESPAHAARRSKNAKPHVPAWEDVLLGVRSPHND